MLIFQYQNTVLWINVHVDNGSFVHSSCYCLQPVLQSSLLAPLLTHPRNFITHSLNSSILTIPWSLIPHYSKNRGWTWSLPKWADSCAGAVSYWDSALKAPLWGAKSFKKYINSGSAEGTSGWKTRVKAAAIPVAAYAFLVQKFKFETY